MSLRVLQANINHSTMGQDLLLQHIVEWSIDIAIVSEPYWVPTDRETWTADYNSEALCFHRARQAPPVGAHLVVGGVRIETGRTMKYLGLTLDGRWNFEAHFKRLAPKLLATAGALSRLLPNLGGPSTTCRRLYMGVVRSMALYGAPVWYDALSSGTIRQLSRVQRVLAVRAIRGYRSIGTDAALLLAGTPPWDLDAKVLAAVYEWRGDLRSQDLRPAPREIQAERDRLDDLALEGWQCRLASGTAGRRTVMAIRPVLKEWARRAHGRLTYRATQLLSGHGYLAPSSARLAEKSLPRATTALATRTLRSTPSRHARPGRGSAVSWSRQWGKICPCGQL
ncbi:hypothetical protein ABMA28_006024 [Loxostege sticticalis]|uniref:Reverse transcriptase n=1 Tax=Loxostege sticticalis TaxID=481309 RepID=A0ABD0SM49_LOXSC